MNEKFISENEEVEVAKAYFLMQRMTYGGKSFSGLAFATFGDNVAKSRSPMIDLIPYARRLKGVHLECLDALQFIKNWDAPHTFFFVDPPYPNTNQGHYKGYSVDDFERLCKTLDECEGSFILTCYPFDGLYEMLPKGCEVFKVKKRRTVNNRIDADKKKREELIIRRFARVTPRSEIVELYKSGKFDCFTGESVSGV